MYTSRSAAKRSQYNTRASFPLQVLGKIDPDNAGLAGGVVVLVMPLNLVYTTGSLRDVNPPNDTKRPNDYFPRDFPVQLQTNSPTALAITSLP